MDQAVAGVAQLPIVPPVGAKPLRNPRHERFCRLVSTLMPKAEAYRCAFGLVDPLDDKQFHAVRGNASKLERRKDIQDRVAYLCQQPDELWLQKRDRIERFLWLAHDSDPGELWETVEKEKTDDDGEPILDAEGKPKMVRYQRLKLMSDLPDDIRRTVESIKYTDSGRPQVECYSKMQANQELRKLLGIGAVRDDLTGGEFERMSDQQLISELSRQANELGINITLTYGIEGASHE